MGIDLLIAGGAVVDGTGTASRRLDVAVRDGMIVEVGEKIDASAAERIDATGLVVAPGFIDSHTHLDGQLFWDKAATSSSWHGCTTAIFGNCGFSFAPIGSEGPEYPLSLMAGVEQVDRDLLQQNVPFDWRSYGDFIGSLEASGMAINATSYIGYPMIRHAAMGERAFGGEATEADLDAIEAHVREGLDAGALGLSFNRQAADRDDKGRTTAGLNCPWSEIGRMIGVLADYPGTLVQAIPSWSLLPNGIEAHHREEFEGWTKALAAANRPMVWTVMSEVLADPQLELNREARQAGVSMTSGVGPIPVAIMVNFQVPNVLQTVPAWQPVFAVPPEERVRVLADPGFRRSLREQAGDETFSAYPAAAVDEDGTPILGPEIPLSWGGIFRVGSGPDRFRVDHSVLQEARARGCHPIDVVADAAVESDLRDFLIVFPMGNPDDKTVELMKDPTTVLSTNDTGAHLLMVCNASATWLLDHWVREKQAFGLEQAVHMLTGRQAQVFQLPDRGILAPGKVADLVLFDPDTVGAESPSLVNDLPGGGLRFVQRGLGIARVIVNGRSLMIDGKHTGEVPGMYLRPAEMAARVA